MSDNIFVLITIAILSVSGTLMMGEFVQREGFLSILSLVYATALYFIMSYLIYNEITFPDLKDVDGDTDG